MFNKNEGGAFPPPENSRPDLSSKLLRDYFAAKALAALIAVPKDDVKRGAAGVPILVGYAYEYADAMLAERAK